MMNKKSNVNGKITSCKARLAIAERLINDAPSELGRKIYRKQLAAERALLEKLNAELLLKT